MQLKILLKKNCLSKSDKRDSKTFLFTLFALDALYKLSNNYFEKENLSKVQAIGSLLSIELVL